MKKKSLKCIKHINKTIFQHIIQYIFSKLNTLAILIHFLELEYHIYKK